MRRLALILLLSVAACTRSHDPLHDAALPVLKELNAALSERLAEVGDGHQAIYCESCHDFHTRAAEALWPFAYEFSESHDSIRLHQAICLGEWLLSQQNDDGSWYETPGTWTGTTTDQLLSLLLAWPVIKPVLDQEAVARWTDGMRKAADYLTGMMNIRVAYVNYCATTAATLSEAYLLFSDERYRTKARELAETVISLIDEDGWLEGEGEGSGEVKRGVDIGYNLEMSLWGLGRYAQINKEDKAMEAVRRSAERHLWMIYPEGQSDASIGVRSGKWTIYGSSTSDGMHPLAAILGGYDGRYTEAAIRNIRYIRFCMTENGLLGSGPDYDHVRDTSACVYHSFAKAKSLATAMAWSKGKTPVKTVEPLPCDKDTSAFFSTLNTAVIRNGGWRGTVCAYGYKATRGSASKFMHRPSGGSMTMLWHEGYGSVQCSSQNEYHRWENSFPYYEDPAVLTPRIECGPYSNLYEYDATLEMVTPYSCIVKGRLKNREQQDCGIFYTIAYDFSQDGLYVTYTFDDSPRPYPLRIIEPFMVGRRTMVNRLNHQTLELSRGGSTILFSVIETGPMCTQIYPAILGVRIEVKVPEKSSQVTLSYTEK